MTTQTEATRLKESYLLALAAGHVARHRGTFRRGKIVEFRIDAETGFSNGLVVADRFELVGHYQLRYGPTSRPDGLSSEYSVWGRLSTSTCEADWVPVEGPWKVGSGPFDTPQATGRIRYGF